MASFNGPKLTNPIRTDVPDTQEVLVALAKQDPTSISDIPVGAKRLYEASSGKWQWQLYNGTRWAPVPFLQHNVDQLDGYHAAITPAANTVAVRNASGVLEDSITGNAATASSATTLSQTLPVNKGGTGATTSEAARSNLGVPPTSHTSTATTYGVGNATQYGHLKLSDATDSASGVSGGVAATPAAVKAAKNAADAAQSSANNAQSSADAAMTKASTLATSSVAGIVKPGTGMTVNAAGALNVNTASTSKAGIIQLNNTVTSTSTTQAATANAVKKAYDKASELNWIGVPRYWRSTNLPPNHCWANGDFVEFADWPELKQVYEAGGFEGMLLPWNANSGTKAANLGMWRPDAANPTGLFTPNLGGQFFRNWVQGTGAGGTNLPGVPEITGSMNFGVSYGRGYGAFHFVSGGSYSQINPTSSAGYYFDFAASRCSGVYGNADTVMPPSVNQPVVIYLGRPAG